MYSGMLFNIVNDAYHEEFENYWSKRGKGEKIIVCYKYKDITINITQTNNKFVLLTKHIKIIIYNGKDEYIMKN